MKSFFKTNLYIFLFVFCLLLNFSNNSVVSANTDAREAELRAELKKIEEEQAELQKSLNAQKSTTATFQRDVNILTDQIKQAELQIRKKRLEIERLSEEIDLKNQTVQQLEDKLARSKKAVTELIRQKDKMDKTSLVEIMMSNDNLSDFFADIDAYNKLQSEMEILFDEIREIIGITEAEKTDLEKKQDAEADAKKSIEYEKTTVSVKKQEKDVLLGKSKQSEAEYQKVLAEKQAKAASIRAALFQLRDAGGIEFGDALKFAEAASRATGVRTAFILGILKQESNIGQNVGSCVIADLKSGQTKGVNTGTLFANGIHPTRDLPTLQTILSKLGREPLETRVSCPIGNIGYGGAMGPSQFIPSTWVSYIPGLQQIFGTYPNPWNPEHAIMATALLTRDLGAAGGGYTAERQAAARYYAGGNWQTLGLGYANSVLSHAEGFQKQIDFLKEVDD